MNRTEGENRGRKPRNSESLDREESRKLWQRRKEKEKWQKVAWDVI